MNFRQHCNDLFEFEGCMFNQMWLYLFHVIVCMFGLVTFVAYRHKTVEFTLFETTVVLFIFSCYLGSILYGFLFSHGFFIFGSMLNMVAFILRDPRLFMISILFTFYFVIVELIYIIKNEIKQKKRDETA
jgi:predicted membrane protein